MQILDRINGDWLMATEIRKLEARLWRVAQSDGVQVILFASGGRQAGKSTTVAYLATVLGLYPDRRIIAVDLDLRDPRLGTHFDIEIATGVASVLKGESPLDNAIIRTELPNLDLLLASQDGSDPDLLLRNTAMSQMISELRKGYDMILLDSPALIPVADTTVLLPFVDGVVLTAMAGQTTKPELKRARDFCIGMEAKILGLVVGNVQEAAPEYGGGAGYHRYPNGNGTNRVPEEKESGKSEVRD